MRKHRQSPLHLTAALVVFLAACVATDRAIKSPPPTPPPVALQFSLPLWDKSCNITQGRGIACTAQVTHNSDSCWFISGQGTLACVSGLSAEQTVYWLWLAGQTFTSQPPGRRCVFADGVADCWDYFPVWDITSNPELECQEGTPDEPTPPNNGQNTVPPLEDECPS